MVHVFIITFHLTLTQDIIICNGSDPLLRQYVVEHWIIFRGPWLFKLQIGTRIFVVYTLSIFYTLYTDPNSKSSTTNTSHKYTHPFTLSVSSTHTQYCCVWGPYLMWMRVLFVCAVADVEFVSRRRSNHMYF
jgi:hypothetical protein